MDVESIVGMSLMTFVLLVVIVAALIAAWWNKDWLKKKVGYETLGVGNESEPLENQFT